jgi:TonB family protein
MAAGIQLGGWTGPSRRRVPRFRTHASLEVTVLRSGIPDTLPGRALNMCERGMGAIIAGELSPGDSVGVEVRLLAGGDALRTKAIVRYQDKLRYGLEFIAISTEQRTAIREWAKGIKPSAEGMSSTSVLLNGKVDQGRQTGSPRTRAQGGGGGGGPRARKPKRRGKLALFAALLVVAAAGLWWRWDRSWADLESNLKKTQAASLEKPQAQVPPEVMQKLLVHRVEPVYPAQARTQRLQGVIALNVVVGRDGSVVAMRALNGPDILAQAAMDALRWWKFEPYRLNGEPAVVETTLAVEFKR